MVIIQILIVLTCCIVGYLFGSISTGTILSKKLFKKDIRELGSKNSGATNMGRVFGLKTGLLVIILDMLKTIIPIWITFFILNKTSLVKYELGNVCHLLSGLAAIIGHCFPIFFSFRGGKAVSSYAGFVAATSWFLIPIGLFLYLLILKIQKKVSLTSIIVSFVIACTSLTLMYLPSYFMNFNMNSGINYSVALFISSIILIIRHKDNIKRIISGKESKIKWMK